MHRIPCVLALLLSTGAWSYAHAQDVWVYQVVQGNGQARLMREPPVDLTYPRDGAPMPVADRMSSATRGEPLTPQQAAARRASPHLIITLVPAQVGEQIGRQ